MFPTLIPDYIANPDLSIGMFDQMLKAENVNTGEGGGEAARGCERMGRARKSLSTGGEKPILAKRCHQETSGDYQKPLLEQITSHRRM